MFKRLLMVVSSVCVLAAVFAPTAAMAAGKKVLYFTHEPGRWHKYGPQMEFFKTFAKEAGWDVTYSTGDHDGQVKKLHEKDFGKGYDAIVYNICFAGSKDLEACDNLIKQTRDNGVPAMLIHCGMHSWWATYKSGDVAAPSKNKEAKTSQALLDEWKAAHGDAPYPVWGDCTGIGSTGHGPRQPVVLTHIAKDHPASKRLPEGFTTGNTELYNNVYISEGGVPLIRGKQGKADAVVMWTAPQGKSQVLGFTIGHDVGDWKTEPFKHLVIDSVNYLIANPKP